MTANSDFDYTHPGGITYDNGAVSVFVPDGWMVFNGVDCEGRETTSKVFVYKGIKNQFEIFTHAGFQICFYRKGESYISAKAIYSNVEDIEPFTLGENHWTGYTCNSFGYPYTMLESKNPEYSLLVMMLKENGEHKISFDDADVRAVIESIKIGG